MRKELSILHDHMRVGGRVVEVSVDDGGEDSRVGQRVPGDGDTWCRLAVGVGGRQQALETGEGLAPVGVAQVVAAAVGVSVSRRSTVDVLLTLAVVHRSTRQWRVQLNGAQRHGRLRGFVGVQVGGETSGGGEEGGKRSNRC